MAHFRLNSSVVTSAQRTGRLDLHGRALWDVPTDIFLPEIAAALESLDLSENKIESIPREIASLRGLREIYLDGNRLSTLPVELLDLPNLKAISLENNPSLEPELRALYDKAQPIFRSRARDASGILNWLANKAGGGGGGQQQYGGAPPQQQSAYGGYNGGGGPSSDYGSPQNGGGGRGGFERDQDDEDRQQPPRQSYQSSANQVQDDDDYVYAQMRARAAARAADEALAAAASAASPTNGGGRYQDERDSAYGGDSRRGGDDRDDYGAPAPAQRVSSSSSRYSANAQLGVRKESPFAQDHSIKMESRSDRAHGGRGIQHTPSQSQSNLPQAMQDEPRYGRRAYAARGSTDAPFGLDTQNNQGGQHQRGSSGAGRAPFGNDLNPPQAAPRRVGDQSNISRLVNPWAADDGMKGPPAELARGVRMVRGGDVKQSPFGTLPSELAGAAYATSSSSAASHVQAAVRLRAEGGLNIEAGPLSPQDRAYAPFEDGSISGNGPRNTGGIRQQGRPNSDIFGRNDAPREEFRRGDGPVRAEYQLPQGRGEQYDDRSQSRAAAGAAIMGQSSGGSQRGSRASSSSGRGLQAPFARETDAPPMPSSAGRSNRSNQSSVFNDAPADDVRGRAANGRVVKPTNLW